ncbi:MAG: hypothetical protein LUC94_13470 [Clostridiales bacterium]|nr:hypothetical protein [Clostridiales bacterium]
MGAVLWGIGKTIGIVILVLLLLVLAVLLLILLVPIRYRVTGSFDGSVCGNVRVTWLLHLISFRLFWDGEMKMSLRILGFWLLGKEKKKKSGQKRRRRRRREPAEDREAARTEPGRSAPDESRDLPEKPGSDERAEPSAEAGENVPQDASVRWLKKQPEQVEDTIRPDGSDADGKKTEQAAARRAPTLVGKGLRKILSVLWKLGEKIAKVIDGIRSLPARIRKAFQTVRTRLQNVFAKLRDAEHKKDKILEFLKDEENRGMLLLLKRQIFVLIRHILPRKARGRIRFGFDDPGKTGQVLMAVSPFYGFYGRSLELIPVFDGQALEGNVSLRGRIRIGTLVVIAIRVWMNRSFRILVKRLRGT